MMPQKLVVNCRTGKQKYVALTPTEEVQLEIDRAAAAVRQEVQEAKRQEDAQINAELREMAKERLGI
jgi:hypothetical protein